MDGWGRDDRRASGDGDHACVPLRRSVSWTSTDLSLAVARIGNARSGGKMFRLPMLPSARAPYLVSKVSNRRYPPRGVVMAAGGGAGTHKTPAGRPEVSEPAEAE